VTEPAARAELRALIRDRLGAIMHNPVRELRTTCRVCATPSLRPALPGAENADEAGVHGADGDSGESDSTVGKVPVYVGEVPH